jgi:hypothetical protein
MSGRYFTTVNPLIMAKTEMKHNQAGGTSGESGYLLKAVSFP